MDMARLTATLLILLCRIATVQAQGELDLIAPEVGYFRPEDPVSVQLPSDMPPERLQQLSVELVFRYR